MMILFQAMSRIGNVTFQKNHPAILCTKEYLINKNLLLKYEASVALAGQTRGAIGLSLNFFGYFFFQEKK